MNITELEKLANACATGVGLSDQSYKAYKQAATPQTILAMIELLREMGECLEYEVEILGFDAACARDALKKYKEMTK